MCHPPSQAEGKLLCCQAVPAECPGLETCNLNRTCNPSMNAMMGSCRAQTSCGMAAQKWQNNNRVQTSLCDNDIMLQGWLHDICALPWCSSLFITKDNAHQHTWQQLGSYNQQLRCHFVLVRPTSCRYASGYPAQASP